MNLQLANLMALALKKTRGASMAIHILWQPVGLNSRYASFGAGYDPYVYGPPLVPTGIPYWFVESQVILDKEEIYGSNREGWILTKDPDLGPPDGYGA